MAHPKCYRRELRQLPQTFSVEKSLLDITDMLKTILAGLLPFNLPQPDGPPRRAKPPPDGPLARAGFNPQACLILLPVFIAGLGFSFCPLFLDILWRAI